MPIYMTINYEKVLWRYEKQRQNIKIKFLKEIEPNCLFTPTRQSLPNFNTGLQPILFTLLILYIAYS